MRFRFPALLSLVALGLTFLVGPAQAQRITEYNKESIKKAYSDNDTRRRELINGSKGATSKDKAVSDAVAEWHLGRMTTRTEVLEKVQAEFNTEIATLMDKKNLAEKKPYIDLLGRSCVGVFKEIFRGDITKDPQVITHVAQMLPTAAKLKQDDMAAYLISLIENPKTHDVIRLHALKAMREMMPIRVQLEAWPNGNENFKDKEQNAKRKHDSANVGALVKHIEQPIDAKTPQEVALARFFRREAIHSLAAAGSPAVTALSKPDIRMDGLVAPTLMKVISGKGMSPPPSLQEKIEAAVGLCAMEYPNMPEYNPDLAVYMVGLTLVQFMNEYNKDYSRFTAPGKERQLPYLAWKYEGKRLQEGMKLMYANAKGNPPLQRSIETLQDTKSKMLLTGVFIYNDADLNRVLELTQYVSNTIRPKSGSPFKTLKVAEIPLE